MSSNNLNTLISLNEKNEKENILNEADEFYEKIFKNNNFNDINNNNKKEGIYEIINRKKKKWNSPSIKNISIENLIKIKYNYSKIIETLKNIIEHEINNENLKFQYDKNFDFYDEYLMKYNILEPYEIEQKNFISYKDLKNIQNDFENFLNEKKIFNNNNNNDLYYLNNNNRENVYSTKQIHRNWVVLAKLLIQKNVTCVLIAITSLLKAIKIIENVEDNYFDHSVSLENKIKIFKYLVNYQWFLNNHFIYNNNIYNNNNNNINNNIYSNNNYNINNNINNNNNNNINYNNNNNNINNNDDFYIHDDNNLQENKPKTEGDLYLGNKENKLLNEIRITFNLITRIDSIKLTVSKGLMLPDVIQKLFNAIRVHNSKLNKFAFFYSGNRLNPLSETTISSIFGPVSQANVIVIEESN
jgi:hypothetical protein